MYTRRSENILFYFFFFFFFADNLTGSKDTEPCKTDVSFLSVYPLIVSVTALYHCYKVCKWYYMFMYEMIDQLSKKSMIHTCMAKSW